MIIVMTIIDDDYDADGQCVEYWANISIWLYLNTFF